MLNTKLVSLLQNFSRSDLQRFRKYIASSFFNENQDLVRLYDLVQKELHSEVQNEKSAEKSKVWRQLFPGKAYDDTRFRRLCSDLMRLAMDFMAYQQFKATPSLSHLLLLVALAQTKLDKHFEGVIRQMEAERKQAGLRDADFHYLEYQLHRRRHEHLEHVDAKSASFNFLEKADYHLDAYYFSKKLEHYCDALGYKQLISNAVEIELFPGFMEYVKESSYLKEPSVKSYYLVALMTIYQEDESYFHELKKMLETEASSFQKNELKTLFIHLTNYCIYSKINNGRTDYYSKLFSLYKTALSQKIIFENDELDPTHFRNIIAVALQANELDWVENFIKTFTYKLPKSDQENARSYNLARIYSQQKQHEKVIEQLREVEYQNLSYALGSKLMLLISYYELQEYLALDSLIDSFRIYLRRNRLISKEVKQQYMNVLRFTKKLSSVAPYDKEGIGKIKSQIEDCKNLAAKKWLLEKVEEF